jgi:hypothetical protein
MISHQIQKNEGMFAVFFTVDSTAAAWLCRVKVGFVKFFWFVYLFFNYF